MANTLLAALLRNESGGRNIPNVNQGTSSGQAQGYFQITTGTWDEFGGRKYAADPLHATYEQQADIASRIPLRRWDPSTLAVMRATGRQIDPNRTLGENLSMSGENFADSGLSGGAMGGQYNLKNDPAPTHVRHPPNPQTYRDPAGNITAVAGAPTTPAVPAPPPPPTPPEKPSLWALLGQGMGGMGGSAPMGGGRFGDPTGGQPGAALVAEPGAPMVDVNMMQSNREALALAMARLAKLSGTDKFGFG